MWGREHGALKVEDCVWVGRRRENQDGRGPSSMGLLFTTHRAVAPELSGFLYYSHAPGMVPLAVLHLYPGLLGKCGAVGECCVDKAALAKSLGSKSQAQGVLHLLAWWPETNWSTPLSLRLLICRMQLITFPVYWEEMFHCLSLTQRC